MTAPAIAARRPPPRRTFSSHGARTWLVPPVLVEGAGAIDLGDDIVVLEGGRLIVEGGGRLRIGSGTRLARNVTIECRVGITIGASVLASDDVAIVDSLGPLPSPLSGRVSIGDGAYLGWGSTVGPGVSIGAGAYVGEGAVVLDDVAPRTVVLGNPASVVRALV